MDMTCIYESTTTKILKLKIHLEDQCTKLTTVSQKIKLKSCLLEGVEQFSHGYEN